MKLWLTALTGAVALLYVKVHYTDKNLLYTLKILERARQGRDYEREIARMNAESAHGFRDERDAALARETKLREFAEWCVSLAQFESVTLAPVVDRARAALASPAEPATEEPYDFATVRREAHERWLDDELYGEPAASSMSAGAGQDCHICKRPRNGPGELWCSYPHSLAGQVPADTIEKAREALRGAEVVLKHLADCAEEGVGWAYSLKTVRMAEDDAREALAALAAVRAPEEQAER